MEATTGGHIALTSDFSRHSTSGSIALDTPAAGPWGQSGNITLTTGTAEREKAGAIELTTGATKEGIGGPISILAGTSDSAQRRDIVNGADVTIAAGDTQADEGRGGTLSLRAGSGLSADRRFGGRGGDVSRRSPPTH